jgi:hypothetical protein
MAEAVARLAVARAAFAQGRFEEAELSAKGALQASTKLDASGELEANSIIIRSLIATGGKDAASLISKLCSSSDKKSSATGNLLEAERFIALCDSKAAVQAIDKSKGIFETLQDKEGAGRAMLTKAKAHSCGGESEPAVRAAEAAVAIFNGLSDDHGEASAWAGVMSARFAAGDYKGGISASFAAMALYGETGDEIGEATVLIELAEVQLKRSLAGEALSAALSALSIAQKKSADSLASTALVIAVNSYIALGQPSEALSIAKQLMAAARLAGNKKMEALALSSLAKAHAADKYLEVAVDTASEAVVAAEQLGDKALQAKLLEDIAGIHLAAEQLQAAKDAGDRAGVIYKELGDSKGMDSVKALSSSIDEALGKEPEKKLKEDEQYKIDREMDMLALQAATEALMSRDEKTFKTKYEKLYECKTLTPEDWSKAFANYDDQDSKSFMETCLNKRPGSYIRMINEVPFYCAFRYGGMHYGPGFRLNSLIMSNVDREIFEEEALSLGVLSLWSSWDHVPNPEDWERLSGWHPGVLDCALQVSAMRSGLAVDNMTKWYEPQEALK